VFVVAHLGEGSLAAKVLFESESVRRDTPPSRETRQGVATNVAPSLTASNDPSRSPQSSEVTQQVNAVLEAVAETLMASDYKGPGHNRDHNFITENAVLYENHPNDSRVTGPHDVAPSCVSRYGTGGGNVPLVQEGVDLYNQALTGDVHCPLRTAGGHGAPAALVQPEDRMAVRRLSPRECERLQGFNDDHTLIPWRNKPADQCPDGPRYKALGNSMAVPCMAWIGKRIDAVEKTK
jgi:DNA (cytosine-5)-methyltransferase 1